MRNYILFNFVVEFSRILLISSCVIQFMQFNCLHSSDRRIELVFWSQIKRETAIKIDSLRTPGRVLKRCALNSVTNYFNCSIIQLNMLLFNFFLILWFTHLQTCKIKFLFQQAMFPLSLLGFFRCIIDMNRGNLPLVPLVIITDFLLH